MATRKIKTVPSEDELRKLDQKALRKIAADTGALDPKFITYMSLREAREALLGRFPFTARGNRVAEREIKNAEELKALIDERKAAWNLYAKEKAAEAKGGQG